MRAGGYYHIFASLTFRKQLITTLGRSHTFATVELKSQANVVVVLVGFDGEFLRVFDGDKIVHNRGVEIVVPLKHLESPKTERLSARPAGKLLTASCECVM